MEEFEFDFFEMTPVGEEEDGLKEVESMAEDTETKVEPEEFEPEPIVEPELTTEDPILAIANGMLEKGYFKDIPKEVDVNNFSEDMFWQLVEHNVKQAEETAVDNYWQRLNENLTPMTGQLLEFDLSNPNATEDEVYQFMEAALASRAIVELDPERDAEKIIRQYYRTLNWTTEEIDEELVRSTEAGTLINLAKKVKPKLDSQAESITAQRLETQRAIAQREEQQYNKLREKATNIISQGKLFGVELTREEAALAINAVLNNEVKVPVKGGKIMQLGLMEALVHKHKYDPTGSVENLMLAAIVMEHGIDGVKKFIQKEEQQKAVERFKREHTASATQKTARTPNQNRSSESGFFKLRLN